MAFSDMDKDCIRACHAHLMGLKSKRDLTAQEEADLDTILVGDEAAKIALAQTYAQDVELPMVQGEIAGLSLGAENLGTLQAKETDLQTYLA
jgi:hypothetical protein